jgi:hypothetical protein
MQTQSRRKAPTINGQVTTIAAIVAYRLFADHKNGDVGRLDRTAIVAACDAELVQMDEASRAKRTLLISDTRWIIQYLLGNRPDRRPV